MVNEKITKGLPPIRRPKLSKKHKIKTMKFKNYMKLVGTGIIEIPITLAQA